MSEKVEADSKGSEIMGVEDVINQTDIQDFWDHVTTEESIKDVCTTFAAESKLVTSKLYAQNASVPEKFAVANFLLQVGALKFQVLSSPTEPNVFNTVIILQKPDTAAPADNDASSPPPPPSQADKDAPWKKEPKKEPKTEEEEFEDPSMEEQPPKTPEHHECPNCDAVFTSLWDLDLHVLRKCTGGPRRRGSPRKKPRVEEKVILPKPDTAAPADNDASFPPPPPGHSDMDHAVVEDEGSEPANRRIEESDDENAPRKKELKKEPTTEEEEFEDPSLEEQPPKTPEHHECLDCDAVFTSLWDLDLHVIGKCTGVPRRRGSPRKKPRVEEKVILQNSKPDTVAPADNDASSPPPPPGQADKDHAVVEDKGGEPGNQPIEESDNEDAPWKKDPNTEGEAFDDQPKEHVLGKCAGVPRRRGSLRKKPRVEEKAPSVLSHKEKGKVKCDFCGKTFPWKSAMQRHRNNNHTKETSYPCTVCDKVFYLKHRLQDHMVCHSGKKEFKCDLCDAEFFLFSRLKAHKKNVHTDRKPFLCAICGSNFKSKASLKKHNLTLHTDIKNHSKELKCDHCDMEFSLFKQLIDHKKYIHGDRKSFVCAICGSKYKSNGSLKQHHLSAHTDIKKFPCRQCGKPFSRSFIRNQHEKGVHAVHKPFSCELCGKGFHNKHKLQAHINSHLDVRPFECDVCHKKFRNKDSLSSHFRLHTGERPYMCTECGHGCISSTQLKSHMLQRHGIIVLHRLTKGPERIDGTLPVKRIKLQHAMLGSSKGVAKEGEEKTEGSDESRTFTIPTDALIKISKHLVDIAVNNSTDPSVSGLQHGANEVVSTKVQGTAGNEKDVFPILVNVNQYN